MSDHFMVKGGTEPVTLRGKARFAKLGSLDSWNKYSCCIYPDQESMNKVHKLISEGVKNKIRKDDDGYCITFSRPATIKTKTKGDVTLDPVIVQDAEGNKIDNTYIEDGTDISMRLETYGGKSPSGFGLYKAARLQAIQIHGPAQKRPLPF